MTPRELLGRLGALVFPPVCLLCAQPVDYGTSFCERCLPQVPLDPCPSCGKGRAPHSSCICADQPHWQFVACAPYLYADPLRQGILRLKAQGDPPLARHLSAQMAQCAAHRWPQQRWQLVVPVPATPRLLRGPDHAQVLAQGVAGHLGAVLATELLRRTPSGRQQKTTPGSDRFANAYATYLAGRHRPPQGEAVLLVDDVLTTGATAQACAALLRQAGAASVHVLCACTTPKVG